MKDEPPFFLRRRDDWPALERWLDGRRFNCASHFSSDRKGNPMLALGWDWNPDSDHGRVDKRGFVIVTDKTLADEVLAFIKERAIHA